MKKIVEFFVKYPIWGQMTILVIFILGLMSLLSMNVNFFPEIDPRIITIQVAYPGASPQEMEEGVVLKIETALRGVQGIEQVSSISSENIAALTIEGKKGYNQEELLSDVKNAIDKVSSFPTGTEKPIVYKVKLTERVVTMLLKGNADLLSLKKMADNIEDDLLASGKVSQIEIKGLPALEVVVEISEENMRRYGVKFDDLSNAIRRNNMDISAGALKSESEEILIRFRNKKTDQEAIGNIVVKSRGDGALLYLKDVATVKEQFAESPHKTIFNGERAVTIIVNKTQQEDMLKVADYVNEYATQYCALHQGVQLVVASDNSTTVRQRIDLLIKDGWTGLVLIVILLGIFLHLRVSFWVAVGIPISYLGMFIIAKMYGTTINAISLFGMILVSGILVDDAIVISENVFAHYEMGKTRARAAIDGTFEVFPSVFTSVFATMVMFMPFFFLDGRMGEMFADMALVVIACLGVSLLDAAFFLPAHLAHSEAFTKKEKGKFRLWSDRVIEAIRMKFYARVLRFMLANKYFALSLALAFVLVITGLWKGDFIKGTFFPFVDSDNIAVELSLPTGKREMDTERLLQDITKKIWEVNKEIAAQRDDHKNVVLSTRLEIGKDGAAEKGMIDIQLLDGEQRNMYSYDISDALRKKIGEVPEADKFTVGAKQVFGKPIVVSIRGKDLEMLEQAKMAIKHELKMMSTLKDIVDNNFVGKREIKLSLKPLAYFLGLSTADISKQIRQGFFGEEVQRLQLGKDEVKVWVRYTPEDRKNIGKLEDIKIKVADKEYPLSDLVSYSLARGVVSINHSDGAREIKVEADLANQNEAVPPIIKQIKEELFPKIQANFAGVKLKMEGQDKETQKFGKSAAIAFPLALAFLVITILLTFRSKAQTVLIILMIPLGVYGAFLGHFIEGKPVSVLSFYGIIALAGIVVNDSVVFLDTFNRNIKEGMKLQDAIYTAGTSRFRAIFLNSFANILGLYPLILEKSRQAQFLIPMAISVAWGLFFVTMFTLFLFPCLILLCNDLRVWVYTKWHNKTYLQEEVEPAFVQEE
jgi:multidrug efflux pump subunit AcrB